MAFGLGKLADAIAQTGSTAPQWIVETLKRADEDDVLTRLAADASAGISLGLRVDRIPVKLLGRQILTIGPFWIRLTGWSRAPVPDREAKP